MFSNDIMPGLWSSFGINIGLTKGQAAFGKSMHVNVCAVEAI